MTAPDKEQSFFDGIDTTLSGLFKPLGRPAPAGSGASARRHRGRGANGRCRPSRPHGPQAAVPALARGLEATRDVLARGRGRARRGLPAEDQGAAVPGRDQHGSRNRLRRGGAARGLPEPTGPYAAFAPPPTMGAAVPGQTFEVRAQLTNRGGAAITVSEIVPRRRRRASPSQKAPRLRSRRRSKTNDTAAQRFTVTLAEDTPREPPLLHPQGASSRTATTSSTPGRSTGRRPSPAATAVARYTVEGVSVETRQTVTRREANLPYGYETRELLVVPALAAHRDARARRSSPWPQPGKTLSVAGRPAEQLGRRRSRAGCP